MTDKRLFASEPLRGIAVLLVVVVHLRQFELRFRATTGYRSPWTGHFQCGVEPFFVISQRLRDGGDFAAERKDSVTAPAEFPAKARPQDSTSPLYWNRNLAHGRGGDSATAVRATAGRLVVTTLIKSLALWPDRQAPLIGQGWSLIHEMYFYTVSAVGLMFQRNQARISSAFMGTSRHLRRGRFSARLPINPCHGFASHSIP
jgi:hypothetical protein